MSAMYRHVVLTIWVMQTGNDTRNQVRYNELVKITQY